MNIIFTIIAFSMLIIVHELGHYIMAKLNNVRVDEFKIGFGPSLFKIQGKETLYSLNIIPFGGAVIINGMYDEDEKEEGEESEDLDDSGYKEVSLYRNASNNDNRSFQNINNFRKISIIIAGVVMNVIFAIVLFGLIGYNKGYTIPAIDQVSENSAAAESGLKPGDKFVEVNGHKIWTSDDLSTGLMFSKGEAIELKVERDGIVKDYTITPKYNEEEGRYIIGFTFAKETSPSILESIKYGFSECASVISQTFMSLKMLVTGEIGFVEGLGGPVTILRASNEAAKLGIWNLMFFTGFVSINLAIMNMLPFPALDGGWSIFLLFELITGKKIPSKVFNVINTVGFMLLMGLMVLVTIKDILFPFKI